MRANATLWRAYARRGGRNVFLRPVPAAVVVDLSSMFWLALCLPPGCLRAWRSTTEAGVKQRVAGVEKYCD